MRRNSIELATAGKSAVTALPRRPTLTALSSPPAPPADLDSAADDRVLKFQVPEMVFGVNSLAEAGHAAARLGAQRPFVVTDPGIVEAGWVAELLGHLHDAGLSPCLWSGVSPNPRDHEIAEGHETYRSLDCDVIIGIGGGSVLDAAKGIAILTGNGGSILEYAGVDRVTKPIPPLLMIPSTAGTGSDVSQFCIVTDTTHSVKVTIMGRAVVPDLSLTDPRLLATMPPDLAAATGLDALTHAIESFVSLGHNPFADGHALSSARLVNAALQRSVDCPSDARARLGMARASLEAGLAFSNAILGATHAMSHQVGGLLDLPHGVVNGVLLPHVIRFNAAVVPRRFAQLAEAMGLDVDGVPGDVAAEMLADHVQHLAGSVGVPRRLGDLGVTLSDLDRLAETAMHDACLTTNPRPASQHDIAVLFREAL